MTASRTRFVVLIAAVVNAVLNLLGYNTIPEEFVNDLIAVLSGAFMIYMGWKNNYLSQKGKRQHDVLERHDLT